jgi:hypothetical protein
MAVMVLGKFGGPKALPELKRIATEDKGFGTDGKNIVVAANEAIEKINQSK